MNNQPSNLFQRFWAALPEDERTRYMVQQPFQQMESMFFEGIKIAMMQVQYEAFHLKEEGDILSNTIQTMTKEMVNKLEAEKIKAKPSVKVLEKIEKQHIDMHQQVKVEVENIMSQVKGMIQVVDKLNQFMVHTVDGKQQISFNSHTCTDEEFMRNFIAKNNR